MEVVLSGEPGARLGAPPLVGGGTNGAGRGEVGPETCFLKSGLVGSKPWSQIRVTHGALTSYRPGMGKYVACAHHECGVCAA